MSGHSKWAKIKRQKGANDAKRGNIFTKLGKNITLAAKEGGSDPDMNFALRLAVDKAKAANMPADNIKRAIERSTGKLDQNDISRISYEALGPEGVSIIIDCQTDNKNRTVAEIKKLVESNGGKFASTGSVSWMFIEKGLIIVGLQKKQASEKYGQDDILKDIDEEEAMLELLELPGVEDIEKTSFEKDEENYPAIEVYTNKDNFHNLLKSIESKNYLVHSADLVKISNEIVELTEGQVTKVSSFLDLLEVHDDVDNVWVNII